MRWSFLWTLLCIAGSLWSIIYFALLRRAAVAGKRRPARLLIGRARFIDGTTIAGIQENTVVRVQGQVRPLERELRGPLGGRPCVYWRVMASVLCNSEYRGRYWQETIDHSEGVPFVLFDGTGECAIDPLLATVSVGKPTTLKVAQGQLTPSRIAVLLAEQGVSIDEIRGGTWRFEETFVAVGRRS